MAGWPTGLRTRSVRGNSHPGRPFPWGLSPLGKGCNIHNLSPTAGDGSSRKRTDRKSEPDRGIPPTTHPWSPASNALHRGMATSRSMPDHTLYRFGTAMSLCNRSSAHCRRSTSRTGNPAGPTASWRCLECRDYPKTANSRYLASARAMGPQTGNRPEKLTNTENRLLCL